MSSQQAYKPATAATPVAESAGHGVSDGGAQSARRERGRAGGSSGSAPAPLRAGRSGDCDALVDHRTIEGGDLLRI